MVRALSPTQQSGLASFGLLFLRVTFGLAFILHGLSKAGHPFSWANRVVPGLPAPVQLLVIIAESGGGVLLLLGALNSIGALLIALDMIGAFVTSTLPRGGLTFVDDHPGAVTYEKNVIYLAVAVALWLVGPGRFSIDALAFKRRRR